MAGETPTIYLNEVVNGAPLIVRDMTPRDVEEVVRYWRDRPDENLRILGVNRAVLGTESDIRARFLKLTRQHSPEEDDRRGYVYEWNGEIIGYSSVHFVGDGTAYPHNHLIKDHVRSKGLGSLIMVRLVRILMESGGISTIIMQTRPGNAAVNNLLQHTFKLTPELRHVADPDGGLASPGEFFCYELSRAHLNSIVDPFEACGANLN